MSSLRQRVGLRHLREPEDHVLAVIYGFAVWLPVFLPLTALLIAAMPLRTTVELVAQSQQVDRSATENPLISSVRGVLQQANPAIDHVAVMEVRTPYAGGPYVLIGWGIRADRQFRGNFRDELFGIFVVNPVLTRIERTLEIIPTPRWLDYEFHIQAISAEKVEIVGHGSTYGDGPMRRTYIFAK